MTNGGLDNIMKTPSCFLTGKLESREGEEGEEEETLAGAHAVPSIGKRAWLSCNGVGQQIVECSEASRAILSLDSNELGPMSLIKFDILIYVKWQ